MDLRAAENFALRAGADELRDYQFGKRTIHHYFCPQCGVGSFSRGAAPDGREMVAVNVRCLDDVDIAALKHHPVRRAQPVGPASGRAGAAARAGGARWTRPSSNRAPRSRPKTKRPPLYKVILLNDDYTPREFVVLVLKAVFRMNEDQAYRVMMTAHRRGVCVIAVYAQDVAETKAKEATELGKSQGYPLYFTTEPEE